MMPRCIPYLANRKHNSVKSLNKRHLEFSFIGRLPLIVGIAKINDSMEKIFSDSETHIMSLHAALPGLNHPKCFIAP